MLDQARALDPKGEYQLVEDSKYDQLGKSAFNLVQALFTFDNIPDRSNRRSILSGLTSLMKPNAVLILLASTPDIYVNEWLSFSTNEFPDNRRASSGDLVKVIMLDAEDRRPVEDILWTDEDYRTLFEKCDLTICEVIKPLGQEEEPIPWRTELHTAPWVIYVLQKRL